jgi:hypothetical protein
MSDERRSVPGTILRAPDGTLYFIPDSSLEPFRVFDSEVERVERLLSLQGEAADELALDDEMVAPEEDIDAEVPAQPDDSVDLQAGVQAVYATLDITGHPVPAQMAKPAIICAALDES